MLVKVIATSLYNIMFKTTCLLSYSGAIAPFLLISSAAIAQDIPLPPPNPEQGIEILVEPAPEASPPAEQSAATVNPMVEELGLTLLDVIGQAIKGEKVDLSPAVAEGLAGVIAGQIAEAAQSDSAPEGLAEVAEAVQVAVEGGSEREVVSAVQEAVSILLGNLSQE